MLVAAWGASKAPGDLLISKGQHHFRKVFGEVLCSLDLQDWGFKPYSLRRGGATYHFRIFNSLSKTVIYGRWQSPKSARLYINDGLATLAQFSFPDQEPQLRSMAAVFTKVANPPRDLLNS